MEEGYKVGLTYHRTDKKYMDKDRGKNIKNSISSISHDVLFFK